MREILFRGKTPDTRWCKGKWVYGSLILAGKYCCILEVGEEAENSMDYPYLNDDLGTIDGKATPVTPESVGQYIGLDDADGNKIFEGDVVKWELDEDSISWYVIGFYEGAFVYRDLEYSGNDLCWESVYDNESSLINEEVHIVGNTYDLFDPSKYDRTNAISPEDLKVALKNCRKEN